MSSIILACAWPWYLGHELCNKACRLQPSSTPACVEMLLFLENTNRRTLPYDNSPKRRKRLARFGPPLPCSHALGKEKRLISVVLGHSVLLPCP
jgi:hypothetical protein